MRSLGRDRSHPYGAGTSTAAASHGTDLSTSSMIRDLGRHFLIFPQLHVFVVMTGEFWCLEFTCIPSNWLFTAVYQNGQPGRAAALCNALADIRPQLLLEQLEARLKSHTEQHVVIPLEGVLLNLLGTSGGACSDCALGLFFVRELHGLSFPWFLDSSFRRIGTSTSPSKHWCNPTAAFREGLDRNRFLSNKNM